MVPHVEKWPTKMANQSQHLRAHKRTRIVRTCARVPLLCARPAVALGGAGNECGDIAASATGGVGDCGGGPGGARLGRGGVERRGDTWPNGD